MLTPGGGSISSSDSLVIMKSGNCDEEWVVRQMPTAN